MNLPYIAIKGIGKTQEEIRQSLIEIETVLVMLGYDDENEYWNNEQVIEADISHIITSYNRKFIGYHNHGGATNPKQFKSTELSKIINYVEKFKNK